MSFVGFSQRYGYGTLNKFIPFNHRYGKVEPPSLYLLSGKSVQEWKNCSLTDELFLLEQA